MAMLKIKKGDTVKVIAGKDKDKEGKVIAVDHKNGRVTVYPCTWRLNKKICKYRRRYCCDC